MIISAAGPITERLARGRWWWDSGDIDAIAGQYRDWGVGLNPEVLEVIGDHNCDIRRTVDRAGQTVVECQTVIETVAMKLERHLTLPFEAVALALDASQAGADTPWRWTPRLADRFAGVVVDVIDSLSGVDGRLAA